MTIIAINVSNRTIDKIAPQEHREITAQQADIYRKVLPKEIKIIEHVDSPRTSAVESNSNANEVKNDVEVVEDSVEVIEDEVIEDGAIEDDVEVVEDDTIGIISTNVEGQEDIF